VYSLITEKSEISKCQKKFIELLLKFPIEKRLCKIAFRKLNQNSDGGWRIWNGTAEYKRDTGPKGKTEVLWSSKLNMWMTFRMVKSTNNNKWRYWNSFGLQNPLINSTVSIAVEINFPKAGKDGNIAGSFIKNEQGKVFVVHSGKITVGKGPTNIQKYEILKKNFQIIDHCFLVGELTGQNFLTEIKTFINEVNKAREYIRDLGVVRSE